MVVYNHGSRKLGKLGGRGHRGRGYHKKGGTILVTEGSRETLLKVNDLPSSETNLVISASMTLRISVVKQEELLQNDSTFSIN